MRSRRLSPRISRSTNRCRRTSVRADTGSARPALPRPATSSTRPPVLVDTWRTGALSIPCESIFGPYVRVSSVGAVMNHPGNARGYWHSDWPFNQTVASHVPAPYPDAVMHVTAIFMLSPFTEETGGTLVVPGSHRSTANPSGENGVDRDSAYPTEINAKGQPGDVLLFDSRLWHSVAPNNSDRPRTAVIARYAPWWLNLSVKGPGTPDHTQIVVETGGKPSVVPSGQAKHVRESLRRGEGALPSLGGRVAAGLGSVDISRHSRESGNPDRVP